MISVYLLLDLWATNESVKSELSGSAFTETRISLAAQSHTHVYMEMLETSANTLQESATMWHYKMAGMAVG